MDPRKPILFFFLLFSFSHISAQDSLSAQDTISGPILPPPPDTLTVGVKPAPPFIIRNENGTFGGVSIDLWHSMASKMNVVSDIVEYDLPGLIEAQRTGAIDLSINPLTVTSDRLQDFDFSQPFYITGLSIAAAKKSKGGVLQFLRNFLTGDFWMAILALLVVILIFALVEWWFERNQNEEEFGPGLQGIWNAVWWSAVTMTTVGYGDKSPRTVGGRIVAIVWMFTAVVIVSSFTASIASSLTVNQLSYDISGPNDLKNFRTGTVSSSAAAGFLEGAGVAYEGYDTPGDGVRALAKGEVEAFVYDKPILQYLITDNAWDDDLVVLENEFYKQYYSFSFPKNSRLLEEVNLLLLNEINSVEWKAILNKYGLLN